VLLNTVSQTGLEKERVKDESGGGGGDLGHALDQFPQAQAQPFHQQTGVRITEVLLLGGQAVGRGSHQVHQHLQQIASLSAIALHGISSACVDQRCCPLQPYLR